MVKMLQAKQDAYENISSTSTYGSKASYTPATKEVKGTPQTLLICSNEDKITLEVIEKQLRDNLKPKDLKVRILRMRKTAKGISLTKKDKEGNELLEAVIKENAKLKVISEGSE